MPGVRTIKKSRANLKTVDKSLLMKEESEKVGLNLNNQKTKIMASSPTTSWQIEGEKVEAVKDFIFLDSALGKARGQPPLG